jgi:hypothetical protein
VQYTLLSLPWLVAVAQPDEGAVMGARYEARESALDIAAESVDRGLVSPIQIIWLLMTLVDVQPPIIPLPLVWV